MKTRFVESDGRLYVSINYSGIHPMIAMVDGMAMVTFPRRKAVYLRLDDVIEWHENEKKFEKDSSKRDKVIEVFKNVREKLNAKKI